MIKFGKQVKFYVALALVQPLQQAKLQLQLQLSLKKLDRFDRLVLDDLGYVNQTV
jgi:DNA replication protein DnaC